MSELNYDKQNKKQKQQQQQQQNKQTKKKEIVVNFYNIRFACDLHILRNVEGRQLT